MLYIPFQAAISGWLGGWTVGDQVQSGQATQALAESK